MLYKSPLMLDTLAAARAELGQFDDAAQLADRVTQLAAAANNQSLADKARQHADSYRAAKPGASQERPPIRPGALRFDPRRANIHAVPSRKQPS